MIPVISYGLLPQPLCRDDSTTQTVDAAPLELIRSILLGGCGCLGKNVIDNGTSKAHDNAKFVCTEPFLRVRSDFFDDQSADCGSLLKQTTYGNRWACTIEAVVRANSAELDNQSALPKKALCALTNHPQARLISKVKSESGLCECDYDLIDMSLLHWFGQPRGLCAPLCIANTREDHQSIATLHYIHRFFPVRLKSNAL